MIVWGSASASEVPAAGVVDPGRRDAPTTPRVDTTAQHITIVLNYLWSVASLNGLSNPGPSTELSPAGLKGTIRTSKL